MSSKKPTYVDHGWPDERYGDHPVTELVAKVAGGLSPFGELRFPLDESHLGYLHPFTVVNKSA